MTRPPKLRIYLEPGLRESAEAGAHNFISKVVEAAKKSSFSVEYRDHEYAAVGDENDYSLSHMKAPVGPNGLVFRRVYHYPFWQIDSTHERWNWRVAKSAFDPDPIEGKEANRFFGFWQKRLFDGATDEVAREGFVYVPLQGRLTEHRSFQSCSPLQMIEHCLEHDPVRKIIATLHPKEIYTENELEAVEQLCSRHHRLEVRTGEMVPLLKSCDYVVSQNSSAAFSGYFFAKPALLFAGIDFHHIAVNAKLGELDESFARVAEHQPDYARYLWWFWQDQSINAGRPEAKEKISSRLRSFGWPINE